MIAPDRPGVRPLVGRREEVETPEHTALGYALADLGTRFVALCIDLVVIVLALIILWASALFALFRFAEGMPALGGLGQGVLILITFALIWGFFVISEGFFGGLTPGKRVMRIRVLHDGGLPLTLRGAVIRNLLRIVDVQPFPSWIVAGVFMMVHPRTKRIGDIAAGTIVVREGEGASSNVGSLTKLGEPLVTESAGASPKKAVGRPRLSVEELVALTRYIERREGLWPEARERLATKLVERIMPQLDEGEAETAAVATAGTASADAFLVRVHAVESARRVVADDREPPHVLALARDQRTVWAEYRKLVEEAQRRGLGRLPEERVSHFVRLYREVSADLERARSYGAAPSLTRTLEAWVGAGHNLLYRSSHRSWARAREWVRAGFPALVRRRWRPIILAAVLFYGPGLVTFTAVRAEPSRVHHVLAPEMVARAEAAPEREAEGRGYIDVPEFFSPVFASSIITNNVQVTFVAFAGGILAGLGTLAIMIMNGVHLGAVMAAFANQGASSNLWTFVLPHGIIELTAICIAGGAGFLLGSAILIPGRRTRREALVQNAKEAASLLGGAVVLLVFAGLIEGFISPAEIGRGAKLGFAAIAAVTMVGYLAGGRRQEDRETGRQEGRKAVP